MIVVKRRSFNVVLRAAVAEGQNNSRVIVSLVVKTCLFLLLFLAVSHVMAFEWVVQGFSASEFDAESRIVRRLTAASATGSYTDPKLTDGRVDFLSGEGAQEPRGVLSFADAVYHRGQSEIEGVGRVSYRTAEGELQGEGFKYELTRNHLALNAKVLLQAPVGRVTASEADGILAQDAKDGVAGIVQAKLTGNVVFIRASGAATDIERAEAPSAVYTGADGMLRLASPVTTWVNGQKVVTTAEDLRVRIGTIPSQREAPASSGSSTETGPPTGGR